MQMPVMDGISATRTIRGLGIETPIVALTANVMKEDKDNCKHAGFDGFCGKPIIMVEFLTMLRQHLRPVAPQSAELNTALSDLRADPFGDIDIQDLIDIYVNSLPATLNDVIRAHATHDYDAMKFIVHNMRGTGGGLGFTEMAEIAGTIQREITTRNTRDLDAHIQALKSACNKIIASHTPQVSAASGQ